MWRFIVILVLAMWLNADEHPTPQCNACYDKILDSTRGVNILKSGKDFYDATLVALGFVYGTCIAKEVRDEPVLCNEMESLFKLFRYNLMSRAGGGK